MDVYDIQSLAENNKHNMNESVLDYMMPNVQRLLLNITIQHVHHHFNHGLHSTFFEFEQALMKYLMKSMHIFLSLPPRVTRPPDVINVGYLGRSSR